MEIVTKARKKAEMRYLNEVTMRELEEAITEANSTIQGFPKPQ